ncbi:MAG: DUF6436 domain-containing protein [Reinekea sp.]|jgi:hypothetical protein
MPLRQIILLTMVLVVLLTSAVSASYWFQHNYIGWLVNDVPDAVRYRQQWQQTLDGLDGLKHPAVIHYLPNGCLCRMLTLKHAQQISDKAGQSGFQVFQLNSSDAGLGDSLTLAGSSAFLSPQIAITRPDGRIAYVGAYSDGIRCNTGNSMVDSFLDSVQSLPGQTVVGLDVQTCRCRTSTEE